MSHSSKEHFLVVVSLVLIVLCLFGFSSPKFKTLLIPFIFRQAVMYI